MTDSFPITPQQIRIGISSCLLGEKVRFDGGHKRDPFIVDILGKYFQWVPVCPEMEMGLGAPRQTMRLEGSIETPRLITLKTNEDLTETMQRFAAKRLTDLSTINLHGYILKKNSPSCGMQQVRVYKQKRSPQRRGRGLFARALMDRFPLLPVEEEGRLQDMRWRENFIERVFAHYRWHRLIAMQPAAEDLVYFHAQHKLTLLAHSRKHYQALGRLTAQAGTLPMQELLASYGQTFMAGLSVKATPKKHADVLVHLLGYINKQINSADKEDLITHIEAYRQESVPLVVPLTLLQHHFRRHPTPWVQNQTYLYPYPVELMLRNHV